MKKEKRKTSEGIPFHVFEKFPVERPVSFGFPPRKPIFHSNGKHSKRFGVSRDE